MKKIKRVFTILLALIIAFNAVQFPTAVKAAEGDGMTFADATRMYYSDKVLTTTPKTYEAVVKLPSGFSARPGVVIGNYFGGKETASLEVNTGGKPRLYVSSGGKDYNVQFSSAIPLGEWVHIAVVHEASNVIKCYINGALVETLTKANNNNLEVPYFDPTYQSPLVLGGDHRSKNGQNFKGNIQSVALYSDARTAEEIANDVTNYGNDNLLLHYDMSTVTDPTKVAVISDLSGNGMHASFERWIEPEDKSPVNDYDFSFAVVGDTQIINNYKTDTFQLAPLYEWIRDNVQSKKIKYVLGLGDITENQTDAEFQHAVDNIKKLNGSVPYSLIRGNHDNSSEKFSSFFNYSEYTSQIGGRFDENSLNNVWMEFSVGELKYLVLCLDYGVPDDVINWANSVIEEHPEHNVIITTHGYLYRDGTTLDSGNELAVPTPNDGNNIWSKLASQHENVVLVLSGHDPHNDIVVTQREGVNGNTVTEMLIDPQGMDNAMGPTGMVAMFYFSNGGKTLQLEYYSTIRNQYWPEARTFELDIISGCEHANVTEYDAVEVSCTTEGHAAYTECDDCGMILSGTAEKTPKLPHDFKHYARLEATPTSTGNVEYWECGVCHKKFSDNEGKNEVSDPVIPMLGNLALTSTKLDLEDEISLCFSVSKSSLDNGGYKAPYVRVILNGIEQKIWGVLKGNDYVFVFDNIAAHQMNDEITVFLCVHANNTVYSSKPTVHSVATCCYDMLNDEATSGELKTLLVDLLNYGAAAQTYEGYRTDALVNANLTESQKALGTTTTPTATSVQNQETLSGATVVWKSAGLNLKDTAALRFKIEATSVQGLSVKVTDENGVVVACDSTFQKISDNSYYVFVKGITLSQMREVRKFTIYNGEQAVSNTLVYSIATYASKKMNDVSLGALMKAMLQLGDSMATYMATLN